MDGKLATPERLVVELTERQHGVVSTTQLRRAGLSEDAIRGRTLSGRLHRVHRGVYAVGHGRLSLQGRWLAAVLAVGHGPSEGSDSVLRYWGAAISHRSAAHLWELLPVTDGPVDVIADGLGGKARRTGVRIHHSRSLGPSDVTLRGGIPVTTPARTIVDLRRAASLGAPGALSGWEFRKAIRQANVLGLPVDERSRSDRTRSDLERDFREICRRHSLPAPEVNARIGKYLVDFLWRERRLIVETDGYLYHRGKVAFQDDRERDLYLRRRGYEVLRLSEKQVSEQSEQVGETLAALLASPTLGP